MRGTPKLSEVGTGPGHCVWMQPRVYCRPAGKPIIESRNQKLMYPVEWRAGLLRSQDGSAFCAQFVLRTSREET